nr:phage/plasmid primase, P4 family [Clostridium sp. AM45-5]
MNEKIISGLIRKRPASPDKSYIFVHDNIAICQAIVVVGHMSLYISRSGGGYFTAESFCDWIRDTTNTGTELSEYTFVLACDRKKTNDLLEETLKNNQIPYKTNGYILFRGKEYLAKYEKQDELEKALDAYIARYEGTDDNPAAVDQNQFCTFARDGRVNGIKDIAVVRYLMDALCMFVMDREIYLYQDGCYYLDQDGIKIKAVISALIPERYITFRVLSAVYNLLIEQQELQKTMEELNAYPPWWINFQNGMFDVREMKLHKHKPEYLSINQIPHKLDMEIRKNMEEAGKTTIQFLNDAMPDRTDQITLWQYIGYSMTRDTRFQRFMIIRGIGGTGKSKVINLIQDIVGAANCSGISLQALNERFYPSMLQGMLLNACADISSDALMQVDNIKKATGEDVMICERKGRDPVPFRSYAKLIFSANKIPLNLDEKSNAFYRRLLILEMNNKPKKKDLELGEKLQAEIGYSIWMAVGALKKLYNDGEFTESTMAKERVEDLYRAADTVKAFVDECLERQQGSKISRSLLYEKYKQYCENCGRKYHSPNPFFKSLEEKGFLYKRTASERSFLNVTLKDDGFLPLEEE